MAVEWHQVSGAIRAHIDTIAKMTAAQKRSVPSPALADDLNRLLDLAIGLDPSIDRRLWPSPLQRSSGVTFAEVETQARRIKSLLEGPPGPPIIVGGPPTFDSSASMY